MGGCERIKYNAINFVRVEDDLTGLVGRARFRRVQGPGETKTKKGVIFLGRRPPSMSLHTHLFLLRVHWPSWIPVHSRASIVLRPAQLVFGG